LQPAGQPTKNAVSGVKPAHGVVERLAARRLSVGQLPSRHAFVHAAGSDLFDVAIRVTDTARAVVGAVLTATRVRAIAGFVGLRSFATDTERLQLRLALLLQRICLVFGRTQPACRDGALERRRELAKTGHGCRPIRNGAGSRAEPPQRVLPLAAFALLLDRIADVIARAAAIAGPHTTRAAARRLVRITRRPVRIAGRPVVIARRLITVAGGLIAARRGQAAIVVRSRDDATLA